MRDEGLAGYHGARGARHPGRHHRLAHAANEPVGAAVSGRALDSLVAYRLSAAADAFTRGERRSGIGHAAQARAYVLQLAKQDAVLAATRWDSLSAILVAAGYSALDAPSFQVL